MRLTLWQQFSSNHSASFTVVGKFESPEKAQSAAAQLDALFNEVFRWYEEHPEQSALDMYEPPTPPERALIEKFNIQTDWNLGLSPRYVRESLTNRAVEHILLLHIPATSWNHAHQNLAELVSNMGSVTTGKHWMAEDLHIPGLDIKLSAHAPDEAAGKRVYDEIQTAIDRIVPDDDSNEFQLILSWVDDCYVRERPTVQWDGRVLTISARLIRLAENLPAFISHLKAEGFTDFDVEFTEMVD